MAFVLEDRVRETSTTAGTGALTLEGTLEGFQTFDAVLANGDTTWYCAVFGAEWEVGLGTFTAPDQLDRTTVISSSAGGSAVDFSAGTKDVFITVPGSAMEVLQSLGSLGTAASKNVGTSAGNVPELDGGGKIIDSLISSAIARLASPTFTGTPAAPTAAAATNTTQIATTAMVQAAIAAYVAAQDAMVFKGVIDASANPNYPAADAGHTYRISVAGKIGGGSGVNVEAGDILLCLTDSTASGDQATVGANWSVIQVNIDGAVTLTGTQTLTNKTLTSPAISSPTGLVKADVGLGSVDNTAVLGKQAIWIPAGAMATRTTNGAAAGTVELATNKQMLKTLDFDTSTQEFAQFWLAIPKQWDEGTVTFRPVWSHAATSTNFGAVFQLQGVAISDDDAADASFGTAQTSTDTGGTTNDIYVGPESSAITIAGTPAAEDVVCFQVARAPSDGSDTLAVDARLHGIILYITTDAGTDA